MKKFFERISKLFEVKSLITIAVTAAFTYMSIQGKIETQQFMTIFTVIISFYFGTQATKLTAASAVPVQTATQASTPTTVINESTSEEDDESIGDAEEKKAQPTAVGVYDF